MGYAARIQRQHNLRSSLNQLLDDVGIDNTISAILLTISS